MDVFYIRTRPARPVLAAAQRVFLSSGFYAWGA